MYQEQRTSLTIRRVGGDLSGLDLADPLWRTAETVTVSSYWSGAEAPAGRQFSAALLWSGEGLFVRFAAEQSEPIVESAYPSTSAKSLGLWDRDVCEIFLAPDAGEPLRYFEFEAAPNGEWLDVALDARSGKRVADWDYVSGMQVAAATGSGMVNIAMQIPWKAFGRTPAPGDIWLGNLFRCVGTDPDRGYLAWQPTLTDIPSFHVPERFGEFRFE